LYKNVLVGTDGSATADKAVQVAASLARDWKATLHLVVAFRTGSSGMAAASGAALADSGAHQGLQHGAAEQVAKKSVESYGEGLETQVHAVADSPADAILDTAQAVGADLIVVGSKGMQGARRVLGSVPNSVAHGANCAVLIVKTD
jgi:nucleotide-binding universal stress UspA family protein